MRYIPNTPQEVKQMLNTIGIDSIEKIYNQIPKQLQINELNIAKALSETQVINKLTSIGNKNASTTSHHQFLGAGSYRHFIPTIVDHLSSLGAFATAYTPYQPEVSQGTLQAIFEFQTALSRLLNMPIVNASMYDGASALSEAVLMAIRIQLKNKNSNKKKVVLSEAIHPEYRQVVKTYLTHTAQIIETPYDEKTGETNLDFLEKAINDDVICVAIQQPNFFGSLEQLSLIQQLTKKHDALFITVIPEPMSLGLVQPPGDFDTDIVVGEAQGFGNPISFGGPYVGFFATQKSYVRQMPGRIAGQTTDTSGNDCYTLTLSTREQHIRRESATSNICTNQGLCALRTIIYLTTLGEEGLKECATLNYSKSEYTKSKIDSRKFRFNASTFNEFVISLADREGFYQSCLKQSIIPGVKLDKFYPPLKNELLLCVTEQNSKEEIDELTKIIGDFL